MRSVYALTAGVCCQTINDITAELHVWPGGFHGLRVMAPHARVSQVSKQTRDDRLARLLEA